MKMLTIPRPVLAGPGAVIVDGDSRSDQRAAARNHGPRNVQFTLSQDVHNEAGVLVARAGSPIMLAVNPADTGDQLKEIDSYLGGYVQSEFVADMVSPVVLVDQEKAKRRDFSSDNAYELVKTESGRQGGINEIEHLSETTDYECSEHALAAFVPYSSQMEAVKLYDVKSAHASLIADKLALSREVRVLDGLTTLANWDADNRVSLTTDFKWNNGSTKNPRFDIQERIEASLSKVTGIVMNPRVLFWFLTDSDVRLSMRQFLGDGPSPGALASAAASQQIQTIQIPDFPPITVACAKADRKDGNGAQYVLADDVLLLSQPQGGVPMDGTRIATSYTFRTRGRGGNGWTTNEYIPQGGRGLESGTMLESGYKETTFFASNVSGGLIKGVLG